MKCRLATVLIEFVLLSLLSAAQLSRGATGTRPALDGLVNLLAHNDDPAFQLDILRGLSDGLEGRRHVQAPSGWEVVAMKLARSGEPQVRQLAQSLSLVFGQTAMLPPLRATLMNPQAALSARSNALSGLLAAQDRELPSNLIRLLQDPALRRPAIRALAAAEHPEAADALVGLYATQDPAGRRDILQTLASRLSYARVLSAAWGNKRMLPGDLSVELVRHLRSFKDAKLNAELEQHWGRIRESGGDKIQEITTYKKLIENKGFGRPEAGRLVFSRVCQQCHTLFGEGGKIGPDLTGANRADLDYVLQNVIDPNALLPNDYRSSQIETKDGRTLTGLITRQDARSVTIITLSDTVVLARDEVKELSTSELSMMPEGLLQALSETETRDLLAYLRQTGQVPLPVPTP